MKILVSGAGIAGLACAHGLGARGHAVTVVEHAPRLRLAGTPVDIRGDALAAADRMGLLGRIRERRLRMSELSRFVDADGAPVARVPVARTGDSPDDVELLRGDLVRLLADALPDTAAVRFDDSVEALADDGDGVDARFRSGGSDRYDLVVGADGQHSQVRGLVFGPESGYLRHLGVYIALADLPGAAPSDEVNLVHNVPGMMAGVFRYGDRTVAVLQFRSGPLDYDHRDLEAQKRILAEAFAGQRSWRIPELVEAALADPALFFDSAGQIRMPGWHRGRVVLVGDAGYAPAFLSGRGASLALTGAQFLAEELERCGGDPTAAFERYTDRQRPYVKRAQDRVHASRDRLVPATWADIAARNDALRAAETAAR
ncbi:FAD-dependent monooxygenase [Nocardiopsis suaedae]|uniref:FAD-dependent monooxygenase n=1 Tax=Nocardiopsis suaedae TaxID=3018444 RepID=A0ABT4TMZ7_9ACTN|nr:FAD-dependent monooxygenase [Nocardiopsis suaedae]MDA2806069.1 FAD-dependent monooxygenase [Nocardiopsis suaedae]